MPLDPSQAHRAELHVLEQALARGYLNAAQLREARGLSAPGGLLQLLGQRYLQPAHANELGQLYQQVLADPSLLQDAERTMEFTATIPAAPQGAPASSALIQPPPPSSVLSPGGTLGTGPPVGATSPGGTVVTGLPSGVRPAPAQPPSAATQPPPVSHGDVGGTLHAPPPSALFNSGDLQASRESGPGSFVGPFRIVRELARGGMGVVYEAERPGLDRRVALKQMLGGGSNDSVERFMIEARIAARLRHPNIVGIHDVGEASGNPYFAMDFIEGEDLDDRIKREGALPLAEAAALTKTLAEALAYAHDRAVLHRDIKPANVLLTKGEKVPILTDFGLAKDVGQQGDSGLTQDGAIMGTPSYMPPEQAEGTQALIDRRADVYSLGATLYACLVAKPPFEGSTPMNTITKVLTQDVVRPRKLRAEVPRDLEVICLKCLEKAPEARYQTAHELALDLGRYLADEPILARPPSSAERLTKWVRRNRKLAAAIVLGGLISIGGTGGVWLYTRTQARSQGRAQAELAWQAFLDADPKDRDQRIGLALTALQQGQRWVALSPDDGEARARAYEAAIAMGRVAEEGQQWGFAKQAYEQARVIDPGMNEETQGLLDALETRAGLELERRLQEVRGYLSEALEGNYKRDPLAFEDAQFGIVRYSDPEVVELLLTELDRIAAKIVEVRSANLLALAKPDDLEERQGGKEIPGVKQAIANWEQSVRGPKPVWDRELSKIDRESLGACQRRWRTRLLRRGWLSEPQLLDLRRDLLSTQLEPELSAARLITASLSRMALTPDASAVLIRYMNAEVDPRRQDRAGAALCHVGTPEALGAARDFFRVYGAFTPSFTTALREAERDLPRGSIKTKPSERKARVRELVDLGQHLEALAFADRCLEQDPQEPYFSIAKIEALLHLGRLDEAEEIVAAGKKQHPNHAPFYLAGFATLRLRGRVKELRAELATIDVNKFTPGQRKQIAALFDFVGDVTRCEAELRNALREEPDPDTAAFLARTLVRQGRSVEAARYVMSFLDKNPHNQQLNLALARAERQRGRLTRAATLLDGILERDPKFAVAHFDRGSVKADRGDLGGAIRDFSEALENTVLPLERATFLAARGVAYAKLLQPDRALPDLEEAAKLAPENHEVLGNLALFHATRGRPVVALDAIDRALAFQPKDISLLAIKGQILARLGRKEDAAQLLAEVLEQQPDNVEARGNLAVTQLQQGQFAKALKHLDRLLEGTPDNVTALLNRSSARAQLGRGKEAREDLEAVKRLLPDSPRPWIGQARLCLVARDNKGALQAADKAIELDPRATEAHAVRGMILLQLNRAAESHAAFQLALSLDPDDVRIKLAHLNLLLALRRHERAKETIREILQREPGLPEGDKLRALLKSLGG